ncbi:hypothetical protein D3C76_1157440 [compost metagenome]
MLGEVGGVELDHVRLELVPADGLVQGGIGLGLVAVEHGFLRGWGLGLFETLGKHLLHLHVDRSTELVGMRHHEEFFSTGVVTGGICKHLAAGADQRYSSAEGAKTGHRNSFNRQRR